MTPTETMLHLACAASTGAFAAPTVDVVIARFDEETSWLATYAKQVATTVTRARALLACTLRHARAKRHRSTHAVPPRVIGARVRAGQRDHLRQVALARGR